MWLELELARRAFTLSLACRRFITVAPIHPVSCKYPSAYIPQCVHTPVCTYPSVYKHGIKWHILWCSRGARRQRLTRRQTFLTLCVILALRLETGIFHEVGQQV
jgi:hypothetical protein